MQDWQIKVRKKTQQYTVRLMNNTKWRETLSCFIECRMAFEVMLIEDKTHWRAVHLSVTDLANTYIKDPGIGGPCLYAEIFAVRFAIGETHRDPRSGKNIISCDKSNTVTQQLAKLGKLPLTHDEHYYFLHGYE